jgi:hypothetical protein
MVGRGFVRGGRGSADGGFQRRLRPQDILIIIVSPVCCLVSEHIYASA